MTRPWHTWTIVILFMAVVLVAMGWISWTVIRLDQAETEAVHRNIVEENARLALWRMDSAVAPLIAQESARDYFEYNPFYAPARAYTRMFSEIEQGEVLFPSPLLNPASPYILVHFQIDPDGTFCSPQVPTGNMRDLAESRYTTSDRINAFAQQLDHLRSETVRRTLLAACQAPDETPVEMAMLPPRTFPGDQQQRQAPGEQQQEEQGPGMPQQAAQPPVQPAEMQQRVRQPAPQYAKAQGFDLERRAQRQQQILQMEQSGAANAVLNLDMQQIDNIARNGGEFQARDWNYYNHAGITGNAGSNILFSAPNVSEGMTRPVWIDDKLLLSRAVSIGGQTYLQGCWLDWPGIRAWLIAEAADLLPEAEIEPVTTSVTTHLMSANGGRLLAALPARLIPGDLSIESGPMLSANLLSLIIAWVCVALGAGAVIALLLGTLALSERRAAFVSAVTHEMRTPLTTFRMYTEMLTGGMVPDEEKRKRYLKTLHTEADRLGHLVENVLSYARLERNGHASHREAFSIPELLDRTAGRLSERARVANKTLVIDLPEEEKADLTAHGDRAAVEQVLINLVDNACKYADGTNDPRIHLQAERKDGIAIVRVRDHGPGIDPDKVSRLFRPFSKSDRDAANSAPGIGLGLALSRRLARHMGGDLTYNPTVTDGACFTLTLPAAAKNVSG